MRCRLALVLVAVAGLANPGAADPLDELGFGGAAGGMASARAGLGAGAESIHGDPAGLAFADRPELLVGWGIAHDRLSLDGATVDLDDLRGTSLGLAIPLGHGLAIGAATYFPDQYFARIHLTPITEPFYYRFENVHRIVVEPVAAIAVGDWAFAAGTSLLAGARSRELAFDVGVVGGSKQGEARLDVTLPLAVAPLLGARWRPAPWLDVSAMFRGELSIDLALDITTDVDVPGVVTGDALVGLDAASSFTPMRGALGAAIHPRPDLAITAELAWEHWSALGSGVPALQVLVDLDITPPLVDGMPLPANFHDTVTPRVGVQWTRGPRALRAGAAYLPSPVPRQTGLTSFADGRRTLATAGLGWQLSPNAILAQPIDLDLAIGWQHVFHQLVRKDDALAPGGAFSSGGDIVQASASATVRF